METIAGYHIKTTLGTGDMASVYLAMQESLDRQVAIKVLDAALTEDKLIQVQFEQESKLIASLNHPNIVQVIDQGISAQGRPYFVMPYIKSISLNAVLNRTDIITTRKIDIAIQICKALAYAHHNGVIHRDIKPGNVLVDYEGHVRLVDFGIAGYFANTDKFNAAETDHLIMGTDAYMSPEQAESIINTTHLSDIYSLGVLMHQLFFGCLPMQSIKQKKINGEYWSQLKVIVRKCLEPLPQNRPASADEIRQQLLLVVKGKHLRSNHWNNDSPQNDIPTNYQLLDVLKENPFGATYLAKDPRHQRFLVIKKQQLDHLGNADIINTKLTHIQHPHIARVFGTGKNKRVYINVSEYLSAGNLQDRLTQSFTLGQWILMAQQIYSALGCAHAHGIIHGNLRPSNILFAENNFIKITDFGFPAHSYSEFDNWYRWKNTTESKATDIYAAGIILFQLLSGTFPKASLFNVRNYWVLRHIPYKLRKIVLSLIQTNTNKRYLTATAAMQALKDFYDQQSTRMAEKIYITNRSKV